ncbi:MAG TPA: hypothetical protein VNG89_03235 [Vicinamibacterales bacterium]|nr:hypothetical protein [Vicinamibacterales bacterium]
MIIATGGAEAGALQAALDLIAPVIHHGDANQAALAAAYRRFTSEP